MSIYQTIVAWSEEAGRPMWMRDALRRLVLSDQLTDLDYGELEILCLQDHGVVLDGVEFEGKPLTAAHVVGGDDEHPVALQELRELQNVNALRSEGPLTFAGSGLTIIYGHNGSGKSGYARILKRACRSRGRGGAIRPNVFTAGPHQAATAVVRYRVGDVDSELTWEDGDEGCPELGTVSVFDSQCATLYVRDEAPMAFAPAGLDLFDRLGDVVTELKSRVESRESVASRQALRWPEIPPDTAVSQLRDTLSSKTKPDLVRQLGTLSVEEQGELERLRKEVPVVRATDPRKMATATRQQAERFQALAQRCREAADTFSATNIERTAQLIHDADSKGKAEALASTKAFGGDPLPGVGRATWRAMWEAARSYSEQEAYPEHSHPYVDDDAKCVLCQQDLAPAAAARLKRFDEFVKDETAKQARAARDLVERTRNALLARQFLLEADRTTIAELKDQKPELADAALTYLQAVMSLQAELVGHLEGLTWPGEPPSVPRAVHSEIEEHIKTLRESADDFDRKANPAELTRLESRLRELGARAVLSRHITEVLAEVERLGHVANLAKAKRALNPRPITLKGKELSEAVINEQLAVRLRDELAHLNMPHVKVELVSRGARRGQTYQGIDLVDVQSNAPLHDVLSEGEQRCVALAAFFAELATAPAKSAIVLDDPVSSLDHRYADRLIDRLVLEAQDRQVIVFTHDVYFLMRLNQRAEEGGLDPHLVTVDRLPVGPGACHDGLPWHAKSVERKLSDLRSRIQDAGAVARRDGEAAYARLLHDIYGALREAWEQAIEEILFRGAIVRWRNSIHTQLLRTVDVLPEDYEAINAGMTKCSAWLRGHHAAPVAPPPPPDPAELTRDEQALSSWIARVKQRRAGPR